MSKAEKKFIEELNKEHEIILGFQEYENKIADLEVKLAESEKCLAENLKKANQDRIKLLEELKDFVRRQLMITTINSSDLDEAEAKGCNEVIKDIEEKIDCLICLTKL